jgi:hypothetical protein
MYGDPRTGEAFASLRLAIVKTWGAKNNLRSKDERMEKQLPIDSLREDGEAFEASVTASVSTKISDAVFYGAGDWDKIPFSVEVFSSVTLKCDQNDETVRAAHNMAYDLAWDASREHIMKAVAGHMIDIKERLCSGSFPEED